MEVNGNLEKSMKIMVPYARGMPKNHENLFRTGKNRKVTFLFSLENHVSISNSRIPDGTTAQKKRRELLENQIFNHFL